MKILKNQFFFKKQKNETKNNTNHEIHDPYIEIGNLVKEARIIKNLTMEDLSSISRIPEQTLNAIENNIENLRPTYPFIRSILIKLEDCLAIKKYSLVTLISKERKTFKKEKKDFIINKFDLINTWQGSLLYFLILILTIFTLEKYFISNPNIIEIQIIENGLEK